MLICHCESVNDRRIREAVQGGARTVAQVGRSCGAGTCCGGCVRAVVEILETTEIVEKSHPFATHELPVAAE
jgi:bacterioferritin-associated ferredoxin